MPHEIGTTRASSQSTRPAPHPGGNWIVRNEKFLRTIFLISIYVFGAMCLVSIFALGAFAFISGVLAGIVLMSVLAVLVLLKFRRRRP
jgi:hypothetical protein